MKLYKHKTSRDTAFALTPFKEGKRFVTMFNINWAKITGEEPAFIGIMEITVKPIAEYEILNFVGFLLKAGGLNE